MNLLSEFQLPSPYGFGVKLLWSFGGKGWLSDLIFSDKAVVERPWVHLSNFFMNSLIQWSDPFPPNLKHIIKHQLWEQGSWNFERMFTPKPLSHAKHTDPWLSQGAWWSAYGFMHFCWSSIPKDQLSSPSLVLILMPWFLILMSINKETVQH